MTYDRKRLRSQFSMTIVNLQSCHAFFSPALKRFFGRNTKRPPDQARSPSRGSPGVPHDAVFIGTYSHPCSAEVFFEDLDDALAAGRSAAI